MDLGPAIQQSAGPPTSAAPLTAQTTAGTHAAPSPRRTARPRVPGNWPLLVVLAVQAALSLRLVRGGHGVPGRGALPVGRPSGVGPAAARHARYRRSRRTSPGHPVIYPPLAALADSAGGLAAARILSLVFMLGATALLWATARLLSGRRAAFFAAALFAVLGPALHLGSFATYDAMSLFLVALASWLVVRAGDRPDATGWMIAAGVALALANATSYPSALFDPVVLVLALLTALPRPGGKLAAARALTLLAVAGRPGHAGAADRR